MNPQLGDSEKIPFSVIEKDAKGVVIQGLPTDVITVVSDSPDSASIAVDATPAPGTVASGFIVGGSVVKPGVNVTFQVAHADGSTLPAVVDTIDVVGGDAASIAVTLGAPVAQ